jgi:glycosyltransferase involved in cell wall biosynthesis
MRVAILTSGRFHVCDLARELAACGHEVDFYSLVPPWRTARYGLPRECNRWVAPLLAPAYGAMLATRTTSFGHLGNWALTASLDLVVSQVLRPCDVLIGMSSMTLRTMEVARKKFGAKVFIERGSRHIVSQRDILEAMPGAGKGPDPVPYWAIARELAEYELCDRVVVPSHHAHESFVEQGIPERKLFKNPYGVDLEMFPPTPAPSGEPTTLMVGGWSLQKGVDVLVDAWRKNGTGRLVHVGGVGDAPLPSDAGFTHHDPVPQERLVDHYRKAHVFALTSRQDGFGMVISQALACGLHAVCSDMTGGPDAGELVDDPSAVTVVPSEDVNALASALAVAHDRAARMTGERRFPGRERLSWKAYGERYDAKLRELV